MNKNNLITNLENIELPEIELQGHRKQLKRALLSRQGFSSDSGYFNRTFMLKKVLPISAVAIITLVVVLINFSPKNSTPASAKEVAQKSYQAVVNLSPEQKDALGQAGDGWDKILKEAIDAPDLKLISYDEFMNQEDYNGSQMLITSGKDRSDDQGNGLEDLQFLQYTNSDGVLMSIGIDPETNLPEMVK